LDQHEESYQASFPLTFNFHEQLVLSLNQHEESLSYQVSFPLAFCFHERLVLCLDQHEESLSSPLFSNQREQQALSLDLHEVPLSSPLFSYLRERLASSTYHQPYALHSFWREFPLSYHSFQL
jgi:hypothetical protein